MSTAPVLAPGRAWPLGATVAANGVNFAVFSAHAHRIELCLYDDAGTHELARLALPARSGDVWHGHLAGAGAGTVYGLRAHGPWQPQQGQRFNPHKLLLDPYARETVGRFAWSELQRGHAEDDPTRRDERDNAAVALKARVVGDDAFDWGADTPPRTPWRNSVLYELHVRGFTRAHPDVPEAQRGSFAGLASDAAIAHLTKLGITAVNLLPVQQFIDEERLVRIGLRNHWGYNTLAYFCPEPRYGISGSDGHALRDEFRRMVRRLHAAGIEVILDVVFNHTAETDELGPTLSWRGLDNASYYRLDAHDPGRYRNHSGCGNTFDVSQPRVLQLVLDCLRYWVRHMHVDGFRFDLATVLGRTRDGGFERDAAFFACIAQDPVLAGIKLIAEPWDLGPGGYRLGQFPPRWVEWNDRFRDTMRAAWLGSESGGNPGSACSRGEFARRLCASSDLFEQHARSPAASLNYVVAHDGFTLLDLVSYDQRHNQANGEDNRDGAAHNLSWNCGVEGPSDDAAVLALRARLQRALLATLLLSQGTPMLAAGAELGHTQHGNNNAYCQDNATSWIDWSRADASLVECCARLIALRRAWQPLGDTWHVDAPPEAARLHWRLPDGHAPSADAWHQSARCGIGVLIAPPGRGAQPVLLLLNPGESELVFALPAGRWQPLWHDAEAGAAPQSVPGRSLVLLQRQEH